MPNLFISGEALAMSEERLRQLGIGAIVACGCKSHFPAKFLYHEVHVQDNANAKIGHLLRPAANFIAKALDAGKPVLVHCKAGICRSATVIIAYLLMHRRDLVGSVDDALALIKAARPCAFPREEFLAACERLDAEVKHIKPVAAQPRSPRKKRHPWASSPETSDESDDEPAEAESEHDATGGVSVADAADARDDDGEFNDAIADWAVEHQAPRARGGRRASRWYAAKHSQERVLNSRRGRRRAAEPLRVQGGRRRRQGPRAVGSGARPRDERGARQGHRAGRCCARGRSRSASRASSRRRTRRASPRCTTSLRSRVASCRRQGGAELLPRERPCLPLLPPAELARLGMSGAVMEAPAEAADGARGGSPGAPVAEVVDLAVAEEPARDATPRRSHHGAY